MGKRPNDGAISKTKARKLRKKEAKKIAEKLVAKNNFEHLPQDDALDSDFQFKTDHNDVVLVNSDSENSDTSDVVIVSDSNDDVISVHSADDEEPSKRAFVPNELAQNHDFIEFGFSSSDDENGNNYGSDDGVISGDEGNLYSREQSPGTQFPWVKDHDHSKQKEIADWLTMEMKDFVNYISPSEKEIVTRNGVVSRLKREIAAFWPDTEAHVFGSCATDLYLPGSDIDMVIISTTGDYENRSRLYQLSSYLRSKRLAKNIEVIAKAKVPIIKFVDPTSNIHIDISFERVNGIIAAKKIRKWLSTCPGLRELVLIVKQFLRSRRLNNVHVGGLGGYSTIMLCYHFLKLHPRLSTNNMSVLDNLGSLLIEFFELYGRNFSYDDLIIAIDPETDMPKYLLKSRYPHLNTARHNFSIVIQDPSDPNNNISRSSYNLRDLKKAFGGAYQLLVDKCYLLNSASYKNRIGQLILGDIIRITGKERDFNDDRDKVVNHALINHDESEDESDGANGNDKYYFSDMTVESDNENDIPVKKSIPTNGSTHGKTTSDFMSVQEESGSENDTKLEEEKETASPKKKSNLDKDFKRDYWMQKGLDI